MPSSGKVALATLVAVALVSTGVSEAVHSSFGERDPTTCEDASLTVYPDDFGASVRYDTLSREAKAAFDRARTDDDRTVQIDPALVREFSATVVHEGTSYRTNALASDCPLVAGVPGWVDPVLVTLMFVHEVFGPLYAPMGALCLAVIGYRKVDAWLRFD